MGSARDDDGADVLLDAANYLTAFLRKTVGPNGIQLTASDEAFGHALAQRLENLEAAVGKAFGLARDFVEPTTPVKDDPLRACIRDLLPFVTGDLRLQCANEETDRECLDRCRTDAVSRAKTLLGDVHEIKNRRE